MSWWDSITGLVGGNSSGNSSWSSWLKPAVEAGLGAYQVYNQNQQDQANIDYMRQNEEANYQAYLNNRQYLQNQMSSGGSSGGGGGGGGSNTARLKALQTALDAYNAKIAEAKALTTPYYDAGVALLPQAQENASVAMSGIKKLQDYVMTKDVLDTLNQSKPAYQIATPIPSYLRGK